MAKKYRPIHKVGDCESIVGGYVQCATKATQRMTRIDETTLLLCDRHAAVYRHQVSSRPEMFEPVTFSAIH